MYLVYVISKEGQPLMPTKRFGRVKGLLKSKQATIISHKPFVIQLNYNSTEFIQPLTMGADTGAKFIGVSVVKENSEPVFLCEVELRTKEVTDLIVNRLLYRAARRRHKREKRKRRAIKSNTVFVEKQYLIKGCKEEITCKLIKPSQIRFSNRKRVEKWLTPTCNHLLESHKNIVKKIKAILPITKAIIEYAKFDLHKLNSPNVKGVDYQNGRMKGYANTQEYVLCRDQHTCQMCKIKSGKLNVHHVIWKKDRGSDVPENLITLCEKCHQKAHSNQKFNLKIVELFKNTKKRFFSTTILNSIMPYFYKWLEENFIKISKTYGYETKDKRREFNLSKTHWADAYLISIAESKPLDISLSAFNFKQFRRHNRANIKRQEDRKYYIGKVKVAVNRHKRTAQTFDSLEDLVNREGDNVLNKLTVNKAIRPKRNVKQIGMGDLVNYQNNRFVVKGTTGQYLGFIGEDKYNKTIKKAQLIIKNNGMVCI